MHIQEKTTDSCLSDSELDDIIAFEWRLSCNYTAERKARRENGGGELRMWPYLS